MSRTLKEAIKDELLTCGICLELFKDPKTLPCLHTFCDKCLRALFMHERPASGDHFLRCPSCRATVHGDSYENLEIRTNFHMQNILETVQSSPSNESFIELYRMKQGLNLDLAQAMAISDSNQCRFLQTQTHAMSHEITTLRQQLMQESNQCRFLQTQTHAMSHEITTLRQQLMQERNLREELQAQNRDLQHMNRELKQEMVEMLQQQLEEEKAKRRSAAENATQDNLRLEDHNAIMIVFYKLLRVPAGWLSWLFSRR